MRNKSNLQLVPQRHNLQLMLGLIQKSIEILKCVFICSQVSCYIYKLFQIHQQSDNVQSISIPDSADISIRFFDNDDLDCDGAYVFGFCVTSSSQAIDAPEGWFLSILRTGNLTNAPREEDRLRPMSPGRPERYRLAVGEFCLLWRPESRVPFVFQSPRRRPHRSLSTGAHAQEINALVSGSEASASKSVIADTPNQSLKRTASRTLEKITKKKVMKDNHTPELPSVSSAQAFLKGTRELIPCQSVHHLVEGNTSHTYLPPAQYRLDDTAKERISSLSRAPDAPTAGFYSRSISPLTSIDSDWNRTPSPGPSIQENGYPRRKNERTAGGSFGIRVMNQIEEIFRGSEDAARHLYTLQEFCGMVAQRGSTYS